MSKNTVIDWTSIPEFKEKYPTTKVIKPELVLNSKLSKHPALYVFKKDKVITETDKVKYTRALKRVLALGVAVVVVSTFDLPTLAHAAAEKLKDDPDAGWKSLIDKILWITDYLMDGIIIFSGISWMFGHRTKAIELLFGAGVGYIIVRHHDGIRQFFELL